MRQKYELLNFTQKVPIRCSLQRIGDINAHFHDFFEIIMILDGSCQVTIANQTYHFRSEDLFALNAHTVHSLRGTDCMLISVQFDQTLFENTLQFPFRPLFDCNSVKQGNLPAFDALRRKIAQLTKNNADQKDGFELRNWSLIYELMEILYVHFRVENSMAQAKKMHRYADRMSTINRIISEKYRENFTLTELAEQIHLSVPYLSKFFDQHYGMNFLSYLTDIRLNHAIEELETTDHTIEQISDNSGFPNSHSFVQAFKKQYDILPSAYRRKMRANKQEEPLSFEPEHHEYISGLKKYLVEDTSVQKPEQISSHLIHAKGSKRGASLSHTWKYMMSGGSARDLLFADVQDMVRRMQKEIGFECIHFHGLLSDEMRFCSRDSNGNLVFSFLYIDKVLEFVRSVNLRPVIEFSFMPETLAKQPDKKFINYCTSEPKNLTEWQELITALTEHLIEKYGIDEVSTWLFTPWSLPNTPFHMFGFSSDEAFFEFYKATWRALKACSHKLQLGTPASYYVSDIEQWYLVFLSWCEKNLCPPDFICFHYYDTVQRKSSPDTQDLFGFASPMVLSDHANGLHEFIKHVSKENRKKLPVYVTEWNNTPSHQDWLNDTCFKSCYITKGILENMDALDSLCYWALTDSMGEAAVSKELYSGGLGLFTRNGIPKAVYYALKLLNELGDQCIGHGDGWYLTRKNDSYQIILYNYQHFSHLYSVGERFDMTFTDRYTPFLQDHFLDFHIILNEIPEKEYLVREFILNRKYGSSFDQWVHMGAMELMEEYELEHLEACSKPSINKYLARTQNGTLELDAMLEMLEVRLITLSPIK